MEDDDVMVRRVARGNTVEEARRSMAFKEAIEGFAEQRKGAAKGFRRELGFYGFSKVKGFQLI